MKKNNHQSITINEKRSNVWNAKQLPYNHGGMANQIDVPFVVALSERSKPYATWCERQMSAEIVKIPSLG